MYFVYELVDPRTDVTGYIGITNNPNHRYREHIEGKDDSRKKCEWIRCLQEEQTQPKMKILEIVDDLKQARKQEQHWIQHYISQGVQLTNICLTKTPTKTSHSKAKKPRTDDYYTQYQVKTILDIDYNTLKFFIQKRLITPIFPDKQSRGYYPKSDIDKFATELEAFRQKHGPATFIPHTIITEK